MRKLFFTTVCLIMLAIAHAQTIVMKVDGIKGESAKAKFIDKTELAGLIMEGNSSQNTAAGGGMATGKRVYQPITILKQSGASSPLLFQNFFMGRAIREIVIEYYKTEKPGVEILEYSITLKNVVITGFRQFAGPLKNEKFDPVNDNLLHDEVKFIFQEIILDYKKGGIMVQDNILR
ncbi:MAG: type VI secretion system tube protein TssD [Chitinophagaceae bacterium]